MADSNTSGVKPTLGLTGVTVNAMALIAPGAFLWITFQLQAAATAPSGASVANDMWVRNPRGANRGVSHRDLLRRASAALS
jgi:hypothetical protein